MYSKQWRRQTIKSGSAFKGELYFQVGQTEGPKVSSEVWETRRAGVPRGCGLGGTVAPPPLKSPGSMPPEKFVRNQL